MNAANALVATGNTPYVSISDDGESGVAMARIEINVIDAWKNHCTRPGFSLYPFSLENTAVTNGNVAKMATNSQPGVA